MTISSSIRKTALVALVCSMTLLTSCFTLTHVVGNGGKGVISESTKQWYVLWGLVPINTVDVKAMAGGASDYTVVTQETFVDGLISAVLNFVSVHTRTVTVTR